MRSTASSFDFSVPAASPRNITIAAMSFVAVIMAAAALYPKSEAAPVAEPKFACATIDGRVAAKLAVLQERTDARTQAIVNNLGQQRAIAAAHCNVGRIDDAMAIYGLADRALTRYVSYGTGAALPK